MDAQVESAPLTVEQMRDMVSRLILGINASDPKELAEELFRDDGEFTAALVEAVPRLARAATQAVKEFAASMEGIPAEKGADLVAGSYAGLDGGEIGEAVNAFSRLVIRLHEERPELFTSARTRIASDAIKAVDFGKLRKAVTYHGGERLDVLRGEVELLGENPISLINMFSVVAPLANGALQVLKAVFVALDFPAEAMTYALFKIVQDIDWGDVAAVINGVAALVVNLHRGSLILGDGSLYTREPFYRISSDVISALDGQIIAEALVAAGEEGEALLTAVASQVLGSADEAVPLFEAAVFLANSSFRTAASILEKAASLPPETTSGMAGALEENLELNELARAVNNLTALGRKLNQEHPGLAVRLSRELRTGLDVDTAPETLAAGANRALSSYNAWAGRNPELVAESVGGFLAGIDVRALERAAKSASGQVADALSRNPAVMRPLLKAALSVIAGGTRGYVKGLMARRRKRGV